MLKIPRVNFHFALRDNHLKLDYYLYYILLFNNVLCDLTYRTQPVLIFSDACN